MTYEDLLIKADQAGIITKEKKLHSADGRIKGKKIAIRENMPSVQKACVLAEELGHYYTAAGDILNQNEVTNRKIENSGRLWAYNKQIGLHGIIGGYKSRCHSRYELADYLNVTEEFLQEAIDFYHRKYGYMTTVEDYFIFFEPALAVVERL